MKPIKPPLNKSPILRTSNPFHWKQPPRRALVGERNNRNEIRSVPNLIDEINTQLKINLAEAIGPPKHQKLFAQLDSSEVLYAQSKMVLFCVWWKDFVSFYHFKFSITKFVDLLKLEISVLNSFTSSNIKMQSQ